MELNRITIRIPHMGSKKEIEYERSAVLLDAIRVESLELIETEFAAEFHKQMSILGIDIRYKLALHPFNKVFTSIELLKEETLITEAHGFNQVINGLVEELIGKMGVYVLKMSMKKKGTANDENFKGATNETTNTYI